MLVCAERRSLQAMKLVEKWKTRSRNCIVMEMPQGRPSSLLTFIRRRKAGLGEQVRESLRDESQIPRRSPVSKLESQMNSSMQSALETKTEVEAKGFSIAERVLSTQTVNHLLIALERISEAGSIRNRGGIFAVRNLLDVSPEVRELATSSLIRDLVEPILGPCFFPVRGILFDKIPGANWKVPWHQDVTIAVQEKIEADGFGPWSVKADVLHVQPPTAILEHMLSVRLHLDNCGEENGALRVIPGSHLQGRIPEKEIPSVRQRSSEHVCAVALGGALLMRPLCFMLPLRRVFQDIARVIHLDFASVQLPSGMRWFSDYASAIPA